MRGHIAHMNYTKKLRIINILTFFCSVYTLHKKVKDISQYLDLNTKIKAISRNGTKHLENLKISNFFV